MAQYCVTVTDVTVSGYVCTAKLRPCHAILFRRMMNAVGRSVGRSVVWFSALPFLRTTTHAMQCATIYRKSLPPLLRSVNKNPLPFIAIYCILVLLPPDIKKYKKLKTCWQYFLEMSEQSSHSSRVCYLPKTLAIWGIFCIPFEIALSGKVAQLSMPSSVRCSSDRFHFSSFFLFLSTNTAESEAYPFRTHSF